MRWTDDHCHLGHLDLADDAGVVTALAAAAEQGVTRIVDVGTDVADSTAAADRAAAHTAIWATAGVHPHEARHGLDGLEPLLERAEVRAVGECGLDYHYDHSPRELQRDVFAAQVALAHAYSRALVIHTRDAWDDTFAVLDDAGVPGRTVFHCFTGGAPEAERALAMGAHLSFSGIVTFPSAVDVREAARLCPDDRLLVETDAPFLTPVPHRGKPNHPSLVPLVGARVAEVRDQAPEVVAEHSWANATRVYDLPD
ncbi:MAG TPA: TatD family hydrolase [Acidimicrobiales bacterium]